LAVVSLGCGKNLVDSEHYMGILAGETDVRLTERPEEADVALVNTCGFIEQAKKESVETILSLAEMKKSGQLKKLIVSGCFAQRYREELLKEIAEIDAVIGTGDVASVSRIFREVLDDRRVGSFEQKGFLPEADTARILTTPSHLAYLKIAEGCDRKCTYCIIPDLRGELKSRKIEDIVAEANRLAKNGVKELNILAQETTEYGRDLYGKPSLATLLRQLVKIPDITWIRIYYLYPGSFDRELLELYRDEKKICKYFDFPIQHISSRILQKMGRQTTGPAIREKLAEIRREIPAAVFRTSVITGFPGETEQEFLKLKTFLKEFQFDYAGIFRYSREEGTPAYDMEDQIPEDVKERRETELANLQREIAAQRNKKRLGRPVAVLIDGVSAEDPELLEGRTMSQAWDIDGKVFVSGDAKPGEIVTVIPEQNFDYDFTGKIVEKKKTGRTKRNIIKRR
jgi:ribosomal protein S12 methylthiotransferase